MCDLGIILALVFSHAEPSPNITLGSNVSIEYVGENYIASVIILVSHHN